jgi:hypothetical protein
VILGEPSRSQRNHRWLGTNALRDWCRFTGGGTSHIDPGSPRQNAWVERWFAELTRRQLRRGVHRSTRALEDAIRLYLATYNDDPRPFVWVKTADEILASIERFCLRTSGTGH